MNQSTSFCVALSFSFSFSTCRNRNIPSVGNNGIWVLITAVALTRSWQPPASSSFSPRFLSPYLNIKNSDAFRSGGIGKGSVGVIARLSQSIFISLYIFFYLMLFYYVNCAGFLDPMQGWRCYNNTMIHVISATFCWVGFAAWKLLCGSDGGSSCLVLSTPLQIWYPRVLRIPTIFGSRNQFFTWLPWSSLLTDVMYCVGHQTELQKQGQGW